MNVSSQLSGLTRERNYLANPSVTDGQLSPVRRHRPDYWLLAITSILLGVGLIIIFSISPALAAIAHVNSSYYVGKQLIAIVLGLIAFVVTAQLPLPLWRQLGKPLLIAAGIVTLIAIVMPINPNYPAHRWLRLGSISFQSVELLKFALLVWLAALLTEHIQQGRIKDLTFTLRPVLIALGVIGVVVAGVQSDLGSMAVIFAIMAAMLFVAGMPLKKLAMIIAVIVVGLVLAISVFPYRRDRLIAYLHPTADCQSTGYQACQAMIAVGSGGMVGLGLGSSVQAYGYLPEADNDSIFAIYAEKFGFIGSILLLSSFVALFARIKIIAERVTDDFSRLLIVGVLAWLSVQTVINIGAMVGLLPLKGITLPFVSYGGTSVIFVLAAVGLVFQISHYTSYAPTISLKKRRTGNEDNLSRRWVGGAYHPDPGSGQ